MTENVSETERARTVVEIAPGNPNDTYLGHLTPGALAALGDGYLGAVQRYEQRISGQCTVSLKGRVIGITTGDDVAVMASDLAPGSVVNVSLNDERAVLMPGPIALRGIVRPLQSRFGAVARPTVDPTRAKAKAARKAAHVTRRKGHG